MNNNSEKRENMDLTEGSRHWERWRFVFTASPRPTPKWVCPLTLLYKPRLKFMYSRREKHLLKNTLYSFSECVVIFLLSLASRHNATRKACTPMTNEECYFDKEERHWLYWICSVLKFYPIAKLKKEVKLYV